MIVIPKTKRSSTKKEPALFAIDETERQMFFEIHKDIPRQGPGLNEATRKAFTLLRELPSAPLILDIGCGPGMQTIELAKNTQGKIIAIDTHQPFLDQLNQLAKAEGLADQIDTLNRSMFALNFKPGHFDVIWSEGAIFIIGFEKGLKEWGKFLKKKGYLVVSEISWLKSNPPDELKAFWDAIYPYINPIEGNLKIIEKLGYKVITHFILPEAGWWDNYYTPLEKRIALLQNQYQGNVDATKMLNSELDEIALYRKYSMYYGYVFYIMQK